MRAVHLDGAGVDDGRAGVSVGGGEEHAAGAFFLDGSRVGILANDGIDDEVIGTAAGDGEDVVAGIQGEVAVEGGRGAGTGTKLSGLKKAYSLDFTPANRNYKVSLVLKGRIHKKDEILEAIRDLARRIEAGDIDLETQGHFGE